MKFLRNTTFLSGAVFLNLMVTTQYAHSQSDSPYSFGGSCSSQGQWTQTALSTTQNLKQVITKLKDNPNCTALGQSIQASISSIESNLEVAQTRPVDEARMSQIPAEISALRSYSLQSREDKNEILKMIMDRSVEKATLSAKVEGASSMNSGIAKNLMDLGSRVERSAKGGLTMLNQVIDVIPQMDECLDGDGGQILGSVFSASVQMAAAFASSGQESMGSQLATTISKLTSLSRTRKYTKALRTLNKQEFKASMACLMELTSESYCQARDQMSLFKSAMKEMKYKSKRDDLIAEDNPYAGFYILNTHVPNITKWLHKIQIGVDPKLPTDAEFQNNIQQEVTNFYKNIKVIQGEFNQKSVYIKSLKDLASKQNAIVNLVNEISDRMIGGRGPLGGAPSTNFFTISTQEVSIPFILLGMANGNGTQGVPAQVLGKEGFVMDSGSWLRANINIIPNINNPSELVELIGTNINRIIRDSNVAAIEYYNQWYIVDKAALVNESLSNPNHTIVESLKSVYKYLEIARERINSLNGNVALIPNIDDTKIKIENILSVYDKLQNFGEKLASSKKKMTEDEIQQGEEIHEEFINTIFEQFNIMQSRSGFLANRMINFVYHDYGLLIKNEVNFDEKQKDILFSQGIVALDRMLQSYNGNPANIQTDLTMALSINSGNLDALEETLKNSLLGAMSELHTAITGDSRGVLKSLYEASNDYYRGLRKDKKYGELAMMTVPFFSVGAQFMYYFKNQERYTSTSSKNMRPQSEFMDSSNLMAQLCIQSLAFKDQLPFRKYCSGQVLRSPFVDEDGLDVSYDDILEKHLNDRKLDYSMRQSLNHSDRVCAFRDFNRKNMVRYMRHNK